MSLDTGAGATRVLRSRVSGDDLGFIIAAGQYERGDICQDTTDNQWWPVIPSPCLQFVKNWSNIVTSFTPSHLTELEKTLFFPLVKKTGF